MGSLRSNGSSTTVHSPLDTTFLRLLITSLMAGLFLFGEVRSQTPLDTKGIQITHQIGKDAVLTCSVKDLGTRRIIWSKLSDPYPISVGNTRFNPRKNYKIDVSDNQSILTVRNIKLEDAGEYLCRVSGQVPLAETITLNIQAAEADNTYLLSSETEVLAEIGATVLLPCHVENILNNLVLWKNNQNDVLTLRKKVYTGDHRHSVVHNTRTEWSLQIKNVRKSDFGLYTCVINSQPVLTRTVQLKNLTPTQFAPLLLQDSSFRKRVDVQGGETITLNCVFEASPPANVTWYRRRNVDGNTVQEDLGQGNSFTLQSVSHEQSGQYICVGDNGIKPAGRGKTQLNVLGVPTAAPVIETTRFVPTGPAAPHLYQERRRVEQKRGYNAEMLCTAIGIPRPEVHWTVNGQRVSDNYKYKISNEFFKHDTTNSKLLIRSLTSPDFKMDYTCEGFNLYGRVLLPFELVMIT